MRSGILAEARYASRSSPCIQARSQFPLAALSAALLVGILAISTSCSVFGHETVAVRRASSDEVKQKQGEPTQGVPVQMQAMYNGPLRSLGYGVEEDKASGVHGHRAEFLGLAARARGLYESESKPEAVGSRFESEAHSASRS